MNKTHIITIRVALEPNSLNTNDRWAIQGPIADAILDKLLELGVPNASVASEPGEPIEFIQKRFEYRET